MASLFVELNAFDVAGLTTHVVVLLLGVGGIFGRVALPRGRRSGLGLLLMALAMAVLVVRPSGQGTSLLAAGAHFVLFGVALWLLVGPVPRHAPARAEGAAGDPEPCRIAHAAGRITDDVRQTDRHPAASETMSFHPNDELPSP